MRSFGLSDGQCPSERLTLFFAFFAGFFFAATFFLGAAFLAFFFAAIICGENSDLVITIRPHYFLYFLSYDV